MRSIAGVPREAARARFADAFSPCFLLTVDTEEEFDWAKPIAREGHGLLHLPQLKKFQTFCEHEGVRPIWLIDYPIASSTLAGDLLRDAVAEGKADVGLQLHPWVNPPHEEDVCERNSFVGNLPPGLEEAKLKVLSAAIEKNFGTSPLIYRAGRYGAGAATARLLAEQGVAIDTSVRPHWDYSHFGGPNYRDHPLHPYWLDDAQTLLELPLTTVYCGLFRKQGPAIYPRLWRRPELRGVLARLGLVERIPLTPEGTSVEEARKAIDVALDDGLPVLNFSFHSPSLQPGHTPYVRDEDDLDRLYNWWRAIFAHLATRGVRNAGVSDIMSAVVR